MKSVLLVLAALVSSVASADASFQTIPLQCECTQAEAAKHPEYCSNGGYFPNSTYTRDSKYLSGDKDGNASWDDGDGDQYAKYTFKLSDIEDLASGKVATITGNFEDGFDWSDGYNVRADVAITCKK